MHHLNICENDVREPTSLQEVSLCHIVGTCNPADIFTKEFKSGCTFLSLCFGIYYCFLLIPSPCNCSSLSWGYEVWKFQNFKF